MYDSAKVVATLAVLDAVDVCVGDLHGRAQVTNCINTALATLQPLNSKASISRDRVNVLLIERLGPLLLLNDGVQEELQKALSELRELIDATDPRRHI